jgi:hypothetical protein
MNLPKLRLLKVDVEGMELEVVKGAVKTIKCVPDFSAYRFSEALRWLGCRDAYCSATLSGDQCLRHRTHFLH